MFESLPRAVALALTLAALAGCYGAEPSDACAATPLAAPPTCEAYPALCGRPVRTDLRQRDPAYAVDLVFLPEGYAADELDDFHARVSSLLRELEADPGSILGRDPARFNRHIVDLVAPQGLSVGDGALDTPLRGCLGRDAITPAGTPLLTVSADLARFAARAHVPAADVVVVLMNHRGGRANAPLVRGFEVDLGLVLLGRQHGGHVLDHELGHALVHLGDEYIDGGDCWGEGGAAPGLARAPGDWWNDLAESPNLTLDPTGARWSSVLRGAQPGGARYARCVYHPTASCRMGDDSARPFCPVCDDAIERALRDVRGGVDNRAPRCGLYVAARAADGQLVVCPFTRGPGGPVRIALRGRDDEALLDGVYDPGAVSLTPSIMLGRGCARVAAPTAGELTLRVHCWSVTGAHAENALTLRP
ncbi:MAG: M64 family metallopeptidase [Polyangiales bacterium]